MQANVIDITTLKLKRITPTGRSFPRMRGIRGIAIRYLDSMVTACSAVVILRGRIVVWLLATVLLTTVPPAEAQQPSKIPRIGYLSGTTTNPRREAFRQGLRELGYVEGKNIVVEWRSGEGKSNRLPEFAESG